MELKNILDAEVVQSLMDDFYSLTNIGVAILDLHGEVLVATGWQDVCTRYHRVNSISLLNCIESDTQLSLNVEEGKYREYKCKNNMWDISTPIFIGGKHVGNLFLGQFFYTDETIDIKSFEEQAEKFGFDKAIYLDALNRVPRLSRDRVKSIMNFYTKFASIISKLLTSNLYLEKSLEENKTTIQELEISNSDLERFAYVASHDLKEPIRMIKSYTELLQRRFIDKLNDDEKRFFGFISEGAVRMNELVNALLRYSRISAVKKEFDSVDCNLILADVIKDLKVSIDETNAIIDSEELPKVKGDKVMLRQLIQNLLQNAIKFKGSSIPKIKISKKRKNDYWMISLKDNGIGIAPEYHEKIFIIFQKLHTRDKYPGTGIGLAVCKKIVELHGGQICINSEEGKGTTFHFTLPVL